MRLKQIKLSGFKSFVDPTVLDVPGQLIGVVGPNGCGKSNIMDAVRWVLGESRANELRGESMQDVIFSGSVDRKPSARASVELVFDNSMGRIAGAWGAFAEVAVKRVLTRDGQSIYSINQQTVRRRDVHDLFLGTGLGPRAYAMIGQGTISRIIESKPEDLRIFLEEAAGVSRYKERRRETEHRLADTRDNLTRVEDVLRELESQIASLQLQAERAERFRKLDGDRQRFQGLVWLARRHDALAQQDRARETFQSQELRLDAEIASLRAFRRDRDAAQIRRQTAQDQLLQLRHRFEQQQQALSKLNRLDSEQLRVQQQELEAAEREEAQCAAGQAQLQREASDARALVLPAQEALRAAQSREADLEARLSALLELEARLSDQSKMRPWLQAKGWFGHERFWQGLRVEAGWDATIEAALRERLEAIEVESLEALAMLDREAPPQKQGFFQVLPLTGNRALEEDPSNRADSKPSGLAGLRRLRELVQCSDPHREVLLDRWLEGAFVAGDLAQALCFLAHLEAGQRIFTAQGHCLDRDSIAFHASDQAHEGRLGRKREADQLQKDLLGQQLMVEQAMHLLQSAETKATSLAQELEQSRQAHLQATRALAQSRLETERIQQTQRQVEAETQRLGQEREDTEKEVRRQQQLELQSAELVSSLDSDMLSAQDRLTQAQVAHAHAHERLIQWRSGFREAERQLDAYRYDFRSVSERLTLARQRHLALSESLNALAQQQGVLRKRVDSFDEALLRDKLDQALATRIVAQDRLALCRNQQEHRNQQVRALEEQRMATEGLIQPLRQGLSAAALDEQAAKTTAEQFSQMLQEAGMNVQALAEQADRDEVALKAAALQAELQRCAQAIAELGPVNLAALEALAHAREREAFLRLQCSDLTEAMQTLEDAVRKIDRETRDLLKQTYDQVNQNFGHLFPKLFGGGDAKLLLTGEEILDAGIQVMAHPPGKRNSSIQLLSGGEKALTAIALVFSMFQLNPAPFCLLDEVDAPLDDANTERYCEMVRSMASQTQFLFITHNKTAMELAQQLVGVTMQERGVSRLVAVDLEAAAQLAQAA
ncbi:MAG: chromosome segregation protein SMC [Betaproteobacteria bacterium]|nr:chromosome segregation protein SMC [Betaproteobacteria bacterium]